MSKSFFNKKIIVLFALLVLLVLALGCTTTVPQESSSKYVIMKVYDENSNIIFYKESQFDLNTNAFSAMKDMLNNNIKYTQYDFGAFITSIAGRDAPSTHFWSLYIDGTSAPEGISSYIIADLNLMEWRLDKIDTNLQ